MKIRPANLTDLDAVAALLLADARERTRLDPDLWKLASDPLEKTKSTIRAAMEAENPPFRQQWLVAEADGEMVGVTHTILLPVPPIYAGEFGAPGLIMEDCHIAPDAKPETTRALFAAAQADLMEAGARVLLASSVAGGAWEDEYASQAYDPLTLYFAKTGLSQTSTFDNVRKATEDDVPAIVTSSAANRKLLHDLHPLFWKPHEDADTRFGAWMNRSLTLTDRDMFVSGKDGTLQGYAISHPATPLHFPTPHDISGIGVIDDYYHDELEDPDTPKAGGNHAAMLFEAAEAARATRDNTSVLVVCPAAWRSKISVLEGAGYSNAITWFIRVP